MNKFKVGQPVQVKGRRVAGKILALHYDDSALVDFIDGAAGVYALSAITPVWRVGDWVLIVRNGSNEKARIVPTDQNDPAFVQIYCAEDQFMSGGWLPSSLEWLRSGDEMIGATKAESAVVVPSSQIVLCCRKCGKVISAHGALCSCLPPAKQVTERIGRGPLPNVDPLPGWTKMLSEREGLRRKNVLTYYARRNGEFGQIFLPVLHAHWSES